MSRPVVCKQYLQGVLYHFKIDGSVVTTSDGVSTGLLKGQHVAKIKKGTSADSNLVTITLNKPLGLTPGVFIQERTLDCVARLEEDPTKQVIKIRTLELDGTTKEDDADFEVFLFGTKQIREGAYE